MYFTHYIWETRDNVIDNPDCPNVENIANIFNEKNANYIFYGHEHSFSHFKDTKKEYICVGFLGMRYPGHYSVIDVDKCGNINIIHKVIKFDLDKYKRDVLEANYPRSEKYAKFFD